MLTLGKTLRALRSVPTRVPKGVGWCRGGNRYVEGCEGFLQFKVKMEFNCLSSLSDNLNEIKMLKLL